MEKRAATAKGKSKASGNVDEIIMQRCAEVSGKQQKYNRIGAREYIAFEYDEITCKNIVLACEKHFKNKVEKGMVCDILVGDRGPSCNKLSQIPDLKMFYVRFIKKEQTEDDVN